MWKLGKKSLIIFFLNRKWEQVRTAHVSKTMDFFYHDIVIKKLYLKKSLPRRGSLCKCIPASSSITYYLNLFIFFYFKFIYANFCTGINPMMEGYWRLETPMIIPWGWCKFVSLYFWVNLNQNWIKIGSKLNQNWIKIAPIGAKWRNNRINTKKIEAKIMEKEIDFLDFLKRKIQFFN